MQPLLSNGPIEAVPVDELSDLRTEIADLREEFEQFRASVDRDRSVVGPILNGMRSLFNGGSVPSTSTPVGNAPQPHSTAAWQAWKEQLPASCGKVIDALLIQPLTRTQMIAICKMDYSTVKKAVQILERNALVEQDGKFVRLKRL